MKTIFIILVVMGIPALWLVANLREYYARQRRKLLKQLKKPQSRILAGAADIPPEVILEPGEPTIEFPGFTED